MTQRLCVACEFFAAAHTCIEKPTWGYCRRLLKLRLELGAGKLRPTFTWADNHCDDFQARQSSSVR